MPTPNYGLLYNGFIKLGEYYKQADLLPKNDTFTKKFIIDESMINDGGDKVTISSQFTVKPIAKDTAREAFGAITNPTGWVERIFQLPNFNLSAFVSAGQLDKRQPGQTPYSQPDIMLNLLKLISDNSAMHINMINGSVEKMCIDALLEGVLNFENNEPMNFGYPVSHKAVPEYLWDSENANPIADLDALMQILKFDGRSNRFEVWMGESAFFRFTNNKKVKEHYIAYKSGYLDAVYKEASTNGFITSLPKVITEKGNELEIYCYTATYDTFNEKGHRKGSELFFPEDKVLILSKDADLKMALGRPNVMPKEVLSEFGVNMFPVLEINNGAIIQTVLPKEVSGLQLQTYSTLAPVILSPDRIGSIDVL